MNLSSYITALLRCTSNCTPFAAALGLFFLSDWLEKVLKVVLRFRISLYWWSLIAYQGKCNIPLCSLFEEPHAPVECHLCDSYYGIGICIQMCRHSEWAMNICPFILECFFYVPHLVSYICLEGYGLPRFDIV